MLLSIWTNKFLYMKAPEIKDKNDPVEQFERFYKIVKALRIECPWDSKQTNETIAPLMVEEVYECIDGCRTTLIF